MQTLLSLSPQCCMPRFKIIGLLVLEKKTFEDFLPYTCIGVGDHLPPSLSCDLDHLYAPLNMEAPHKIWL